MLATLEQGVRGGRWHSLIDKLYPIATLRAAFAAVSANRGAAGVDHVTIERYASDLDANLERLSEALRNGTYRPQAIRRHYIEKHVLGPAFGRTRGPGSQEKRPLGIPTVQDRVVQTALRMVLEPIYERDFAAQSYGFRPGIGCKDALRRVDALLKAGYIHVVDADLKSYFDTIPKDRLLALVAGKVADGRILALTEAFLGQSVLEDTQEWVPEQGTPQGAVISPLLSNIYLDPLDHLMTARGFEMVRYADDFVVLCRNPQEAAEALAVVQGWTAQAGLTLQRADRFRRIDPLRGSIRSRRSWCTPGAMGSTSLAITSNVAVTGRARRASGSSRTPSGQRPGERWDTLCPRCRGHQPDAEWLVWLFPAQLPPNVPHGRRLGSPAAAEHSPAAPRGEGDRVDAWGRSDTLAECLLCQTWAVQLAGRL